MIVKTVPSKGKQVITVHIQTSLFSSEFLKGEQIANAVLWLKITAVQSPYSRVFSLSNTMLSWRISRIQCISILSTDFFSYVQTP